MSQTKLVKIRYSCYIFQNVQIDTKVNGLDKRSKREEEDTDRHKNTERHTQIDRYTEAHSQTDNQTDKDSGFKNDIGFINTNSQI